MDPIVLPQMEGKGQAKDAYMRAVYMFQELLGGQELQLKKK